MLREAACHHRNILSSVSQKEGVYSFLLDGLQAPNLTALCCDYNDTTKETFILIISMHHGFIYDGVSRWQAEGGT